MSLRHLTLAVHATDEQFMMMWRLWSPEAFHVLVQHPHIPSTLTSHNLSHTLQWSTQHKMKSITFNTFQVLNELCVNQDTIRLLYDGCDDASIIHGMATYTERADVHLYVYGCDGHHG